MSRHDAYPLLARLHNDGIAEAVAETAGELSGFADHALATCERYRPGLVTELAGALDAEEVRPSMAALRRA